MLQDIREEHAIQAFSNMDENYRGFITTLQFYDILTTIKQHLITPFVQENIVTVSILETSLYGKILDFKVRLHLAFFGPFLTVKRLIFTARVRSTTGR